MLTSHTLTVIRSDKATIYFQQAELNFMQMSSDRTKQQPMGMQAVGTPIKNCVTSNILIAVSENAPLSSCKNKLISIHII